MSCWPLGTEVQGWLNWKHSIKLRFHFPHVCVMDDKAPLFISKHEFIWRHLFCFVFSETGEKRLKKLKRLRSFTIICFFLKKKIMIIYLHFSSVFSSLPFIRSIFDAVCSKPEDVFSWKILWQFTAKRNIKFEKVWGHRGDYLIANSLLLTKKDF